MAITRDQLEADNEARYRDNVVTFHQSLNRTHRMGAVINFASCAVAGIVAGVGCATVGHRVLPVACGLFALVGIAGGWISHQLATVEPGQERRFHLTRDHDLIVSGITYRRVPGDPRWVADFEMVRMHSEWSIASR